MPPTFVNTDPSDSLARGGAYRVTFEQNTVEHFIFGDAMAGIYERLGADELLFPISSAPLDDSAVLVIDVKVRQDVPSLTVADLVNDIGDKTYGVEASITRVEKLVPGNQAPISDVRKAAEQEQKDRGLGLGLPDLGKTLGSLKWVVIGLGAIAIGFAVVYGLKEVRALRHS